MGCEILFRGYLRIESVPRRSVFWVLLVRFLFYLLIRSWIPFRAVSAIETVPKRSKIITERQQVVTKSFCGGVVSALEIVPKTIMRFSSARIQLRFGTVSIAGTPLNGSTAP